MNPRKTAADSVSVFAQMCKPQWGRCPVGRREEFLSVCPFMSPSLCSSVRFSNHCIGPSISPSTHPPLRWSVCMYAYPSVPLPPSPCHGTERASNGLREHQRAFEVQGRPQTTMGYYSLLYAFLYFHASFHNFGIIFALLLFSAIL